MDAGRRRWKEGLVLETVRGSELTDRRSQLSILGVLAALALLTALPASARPDLRPAMGDAALAAEFDDEDFGDDFVAERGAVSDPLESVNRRTLAFNRALDGWVFDPITQVYQYVVPSPARDSVRRFLANLDTPVVLVNDLLQRQWDDAGVTAARFGINTTIGVAGLFDPAASVGMEGHTSDFGQTLALEGVPSGAYIVVPVLGPTTVRDGLGDIVDLMFRPITFLLGPVDQIFYAALHGGGKGLVVRDEVSDELRMLEESSIDFYAALRNAYCQSRDADIWGRRSNHESLSSVAYAWVSPTPDGVSHASLAQR